MYCYYPLDEQWPARISEAMKDANVSFQWDYPYDDDFTYKGGLGGTLDDEPFTCMRDVRRHGQDVTLTLTIDPHVSDEQLAAIGDDLRTFGQGFPAEPTTRLRETGSRSTSALHIRKLRTFTAALQG